MTSTKLKRKNLRPDAGRRKCKTQHLAKICNVSLKMFRADRNEKCDVGTPIMRQEMRGIVQGCVLSLAIKIFLRFS